MAIQQRRVFGALKEGIGFQVVASLASLGCHVAGAPRNDEHNGECYVH